MSRLLVSRLLACRLISLSPSTSSTPVRGLLRVVVAWLIVVASVLLVGLHAVLFFVVASFLLFLVISHVNGGFGSSLASGFSVVARLLPSSATTLLTFTLVSSIVARRAQLGHWLLLTLRPLSEKLDEPSVLVLVELALELSCDVHQMRWLQQCASVELALAVDV